MIGKEVGQVPAYSCCRCCWEGEKKKEKKGLKENQMEEDYGIATNERTASCEVGDQEVLGVNRPLTHSGLGNKQWSRVG